MEFSQNQVQQLYVAKSLSTSALSNSNAIGTIKVKADAGKNHLYIQQRGNGGVVRSDLVKLDRVLNVTATSSAKMAYPYKRYELTLNSSVGLIVGQDYLLRVHFYNYIGMTDYDQYIKDVIVRAYTGMDVSTFYATMYNALVKNFSREVVPIVNISLDAQQASVVMPSNTGLTIKAVSTGTDGNNLKFAIASISATTASITSAVSNGITTITANLTTAAHTIGDLQTLIAANTGIAALITANGTAATVLALDTTAIALSGGGNQGIIFEEAPQNWILGTMPFNVIPFVVQPQPSVTVSGVYTQWGVVTTLTSANYEQNGKKIADLEYFCMGNRGDIYRNMGYPYVIKTNYIADPTLKYDVLNIHYEDHGANDAVEKSEKDLTIVALDDGSHTLINSIITSINGQTNLNITAVS